MRTRWRPSGRPTAARRTARTWPPTSASAVGERPRWSGADARTAGDEETEATEEITESAATGGARRAAVHRVMIDGDAAAAPSDGGHAIAARLGVIAMANPCENIARSGCASRRSLHSTHRRPAPYLPVPPRATVRLILNFCVPRLSPQGMTTCLRVLIGTVVWRPRRSMRSPRRAPPRQPPCRSTVKSPGPRRRRRRSWAQRRSSMRSPRRSSACWSSF